MLAATHKKRDTNASQMSLVETLKNSEKILQGQDKVLNSFSNYMSKQKEKEGENSKTFIDITEN